MIQNSHKEVISQLTEVGFTAHEAAIYLAVLKRGEASAGMVLDEVHLHREQVYRALKRLVDGGFLTQFTKRKRSYYTAVDPEVLVRNTKTRVTIAESLQPFLQAVQSKKQQIITVREGVEAYQALFDDIIYTIGHDGEYLVISGLGNRFYNMTREIYPPFARNLQRRNISVRLIGFEASDYSEQLNRQDMIKVRQVGEPYGVPVATVIYGEKVAIEVYDSENVAIITIENPNIAEAYRQTFNSLWRLGKDVNQPVK